MGENNTPTAIKGCGVKTGVTVDVSAKNALPTFLFGGSRDKLRDLVGASRDQLRDLARRTRDWLTALPAPLQSTKPHYRQQGRVCKAGTGIPVEVSSEERTSDLPGR